MARRLVCTEDGANKFWEGVVEGSTLTTRWGKVGTAGQTKAKAFASAEAAQHELDKLVREKTGKGYVEEGAAPAPAAAAPPAAPAESATALGKYTRALVAMLEAKPKRSAPHAGFAAWAAAETRPELRALFAAMAEREYKYVEVGEFLLAADVGPVPAPGGESDRTDVIWLGTSGGGDGYVVAAPGSTQSRIQRVIHDEDWSTQGGWRDVESLLAEQVETQRREQMEEGTAVKDVSIELETYIRAPGDDREEPVAGGKLTLVKGTGRRKDVRDVRDRWGGKPAPTEFSRFFYAETRWDYADVGYRSFYWHGRYTFASIAAPLEGAPESKRVARAVVYDRGGEKPAWKAIEPALFREFGCNENIDSSMPYGFSADDARLLVGGSPAIAFADGKVVESGGTYVLCVVAETAAGTPVCEGSADIVGVGWVGSLAGVFRKGKKGNSLDLYESAGGAWKLQRSLPCGKLDALIPFAGGRAVAVTKASRGKVKSHFLAVRGSDVRPLGSVDGAVYQAYTLPDGKTVVSTDAGDNKWHELRHLDESIEAAFAGAQPELVLG
jgi:predicted DNA-binding WGR domain protein